MASALRMTVIGITWLVCMLVLAFLTYLGAMFQKVMNELLMGFYFSPSLQHDVGNSWWIMPLYYVLIIIVAFAITYRCYQEVVITANYYPESGGF